MQPPDTNNRLRPGVRVLGSCAIAVVVILIAIAVLARNKSVSADTTVPPPPKETGGETQTGVPEVAAEPMVVTNATAPGVPTALDEPWGIQISSVWLADDGAALGVSYKVLDPDKATLLSDDSIPVLLMDQASGAKLSLRVQSPMGAVPKHSQARSKALAAQQPWSFPPPRNKLIAGREYSFVISNPQKTVKPGSLVVLVVGSFQTPEITVR